MGTKTKVFTLKRFFFIFSTAFQHLQTNGPEYITLIL